MKSHKHEDDGDKMEGDKRSFLIVEKNVTWYWTYNDGLLLSGILATSLVFIKTGCQSTTSYL